MFNESFKSFTNSLLQQHNMATAFMNKMASGVPLQHSTTNPLQQINNDVYSSSGSTSLLPKRVSSSASSTSSKSSSYSSSVELPSKKESSTVTNAAAADSALSSSSSPSSNSSSSSISSTSMKSHFQNHHLNRHQQYDTVTEFPLNLSMSKNGIANGAVHLQQQQQLAKKKRSKYDINRFAEGLTSSDNPF